MKIKENKNSDFTQRKHPEFEAEPKNKCHLHFEGYLNHKSATVEVKITVLWDVTPCILAEIYRRLYHSTRC
jgi:hypothetical protein